MNPELSENWYVDQTGLHYDEFYVRASYGDSFNAVERQYFIEVWEPPIEAETNNIIH